jgi:hypothetical protein
MIPSRKQPGAAFRATVVVSLPLLYLLGFGPACWIATRCEPLRGFVNAIYSPASWAYFKTPHVVGRTIVWYANVGGDVNFYGTERGGFRLKFEPDTQLDDLPPPPPPSR